MMNEGEDEFEVRNERNHHSSISEDVRRMNTTTLLLIPE